MPAAPLSDCTVGVFQEENVARNNHYADPKKIPRKRYTHNPYYRLNLKPVAAAHFSSSCSDEKKKRYEPNPDAPAFVPTDVLWETYSPYECDQPKYTPAYEYVDYFGSYYYSSPPANDYQTNTTPFKQRVSAADQANTGNTTAEKGVNLSQTTVSCGNTGTSVMSTPIKRCNNLYKMYVDGRPKVICGITTAEVNVELRLSTESFMISDVSKVFGFIANAEELIDRYVIVEGDRGEDMGRITSVLGCDLSCCKEDKDREKPLLYVLRAATSEDMESFEALDKLEKEALQFCKESILSLNIRTPLEVQRAVFQFDLKKLSFTYRSDSYVEFKALLRALNRQYQCRIWMHQLNWEVNCRPRAPPPDDEPAPHRAPKDSRRRYAPKRDFRRRTEEKSA